MDTKTAFFVAAFAIFSILSGSIVQVSADNGNYALVMH